MDASISANPAALSANPAALSADLAANPALDPAPNLVSWMPT